jgi:hypothetical protein
MANTTRFMFEIPDVGADADQWGTILNAYFNSLEGRVTDKNGDSGANLTNLNATNITTGTLANARTTGTSANTPNALVLRDANGGFVAGAATLSSTITNTYNVLAQSVSVSGAVILDLGVANYFTGSAVSSASFVFSNPAASGRAHDFILELANGGNFTISWPASVRWPGGVSPTLSQNGTDILAFITDDGGANWRGAVVQKDSR